MTGLAHAEPGPAVPADVDVVVPVHGNAPTLEHLHHRLDAALGPRLRTVVYVDDASPDDSGAVLGALAERDPRVRLVVRPANGGQHRALLDGLRASTADWVVTIDADLQDPPEAVPVLLATGEQRRAGMPAPVVFAGRHGRYESRGRLATSRAFKRLLGLLTGVPADASSFMALPRRVVDAVLALEGPAPFLTAMVAATGAPSTSVRVARAAAERSGYSGAARLRSALAALRWVPRSRAAPGPGDAAEHNRIQLDYYATRQSVSIKPRRTRYVQRQVGEAVADAGLRTGERVLDVGCGMGRATLLLADAGLHVEGADLSPDLLARFAETPGAAIPVHKADIAALPPHLHGRFDAVAGFFVLHHLHDLTRALAGARRALRPGGRIVFVEPNALCPLFYLQIGLVPGMSFRADGGIVHMRSAPLRAACTAAGFTHVQQRTFGLLPPFAVNRPRGAALERVLEGVPGIGPVRAFRLLTAQLPAVPASEPVEEATPC